MKYCINCGAQVKEEHAYCNRCGASLNYVGKPDSKAAHAELNVPGCSAENEIAASSVPKSSRQDTVSSQNNNAAPKKSKRKFKKDTPQQMAAYSLVIGILSFLTCCRSFPELYLVGIICMTVFGGIGMIPGILALKKPLLSSEKTMAVIGVTLGGLALLGGIITLILIAAGMFDQIGDYLSQSYS